MRCLAWGADDSCLTSAGAEGAVYEWSLKDMRRVRENVLKVQLPHSSLRAAHRTRCTAGRMPV